MTRAKVIPPEVRSELDRLLKCANRAHTTQDRVTEASCLLRWAELYRSVDAKPSPAPAVILTERQAARHRTVHDTPLWRVRQRLSPLVAIVRVEEVRFRNQAGHDDNYWLEHLSCGHTQTYHDTLDYPARSKRRRCKECGEVALIAAGYIGDLARNHEPMGPPSTATLAHSLPPSSTPQFTFNVKPAPAESVKPRVVAMLKPATPATGHSEVATTAADSAIEMQRRG